MALVVTLPEVQQWLDNVKLSIDAVDVNLHDTYRDMVYGYVATAYDTSGWVDVESTPSLIRKCIAMLMASRLYKRAYSEDNFGAGGDYGSDLEDYAMNLVLGIAAMAVHLPTENPVLVSDEPGFYPTDASSTDYCTGNPMKGEGAKFQMGMSF